MEGIYAEVPKLPNLPDMPSAYPPLTAVSREEWGAAPPRETEPLLHPIKTAMFAYNTGEPICRDRVTCIQTVQRLQKKHMDLGLSDIFYNFVVGGDGVLYEGRGWNVKHPKSANYHQGYGNTFVIGIIGDEKGFDEWRPAYEVVAPAMNLLRGGIRENKIIEYHDVREDRSEIQSCQMPGC